MQFHLLGPLEIHGPTGQRTTLKSRQARLLAALLLSANHVLTRQRLIDAVWDETPPATAARQLKNLASQLRRRLAESGLRQPVITSNWIGYEIQVDAVQLDTLRFGGHLGHAENLLRNGLAAAAARELRAALALWRGPAMVGCTGRVLAASAARLNEQRLATIEQCIDLELRLGLHHQLTAELTELVAAHPLRERLVGHLMLALSRCGRRADALAVYRQLSARLADELGIDPGGEVQDVHRAILCDDSAVAAPAVSIMEHGPATVEFAIFG
jgi:DNA-binding SARP family transcriptional activator